LAFLISTVQIIAGRSSRKALTREFRPAPKAYATPLAQCHSPSATARMARAPGAPTHAAGASPPDHPATRSERDRLTQRHLRGACGRFFKLEPWAHSTGNSRSNKLAVASVTFRTGSGVVRVSVSIDQSHVSTWSPGTRQGLAHQSTLRTAIRPDRREHSRFVAQTYKAGFNSMLSKEPTGTAIGYHLPMQSCRFALVGQTAGERCAHTRRDSGPSGRHRSSRAR